MNTLLNIIFIFVLAIPLFAQDDTPPELTYFSFTPDSVDITDGAAVVDLILGAIDDMSGMSGGEISFYSPSGDQSELSYFDFEGSMSDTLTAQMTIDQYSESGEWYVHYIQVYDEDGNYQNYDT